MLARLWRRIRLPLFILLALGLIGAGLWYRPAFTWPIGGDGGIASLEPVTLGGDREWILIRGADRTKPVVLMLLGEPGEAQIPIAHALPAAMERDFVVVQWDRIGAGKSWPEDGATPRLAMARDVADGSELVKILYDRFGGRRVILVGQGYGSRLAVALAQRHPDLVRAYLGAAQAACPIEDERAVQDSWLRAKARLRGDDRILAQAVAGGDWDRAPAIRRYGGAMADGGQARLDWVRLVAPEYRLRDQLNAGKGRTLARAGFALQDADAPLERPVPRLEVPSLFIIGERDLMSPSLCAERYAAAMHAPSKRTVWYPKSAHFPFLEEPERFETDLQALADQTADRR